MYDETKFTDKPINLSVAEGTKGLHIKYEEIRTKEVIQWNPRSYELHSVDSIAEFVKQKGTKENTIVFYDESKVEVVLDETINDRPLDTLKYSYQKSMQLIDWNKVLDNWLTQKDFVRFLKSREDEEIVPNKENLIIQFSKLNLVTNIVGEYHQDDHGNVTFAYKESQGKEGIANIPTQLLINIPFLNGSEFEQVVELDIELKRPKSEDEKPMIKITCPKYQLYLKRAIDNETDKLKELLEGYIILNGCK